MDRPERRDTAQRALLYAAIAVAVVVILVLIWYAIDVVLGVLFGRGVAGEALQLVALGLLAGLMEFIPYIGALGDKNARRPGSG